MISGAHPGLKKGNTPLDQWRVLDVRSNGWEGERSYTGGNSCRESPSGLTPLACGARDRKGLVCVCFFFPRSFSDVRSGARRQLWYLARPVLNEVRNYWSPPQAAAS